MAHDVRDVQYKLQCMPEALRGGEDCRLVSSVGMAAAFSARRWVPYAGRAWVQILVVLDSETNLSYLPVPVHSLAGLTLLPTPNPPSKS